MRFNLPKEWIGRTLRIFLVGCGGTGSSIAMDSLPAIHHALRALGREETFRLTIFDPDAVEQTNIGRQRFLPGADLGHNKAQIAAHRLSLFHGMDASAVPERFDPAKCSCWPDLLITAVDNAATRLAIWEAGQNLGSGYWNGAGCLWGDSGNSRYSGQYVIGHLAPDSDVPLRLPNVCDLFPDLDRIEQEVEETAPVMGCGIDNSSQSLFINRVIGTHMMSTLWLLLRQGYLEHHGEFIEMAPPSNRLLPVNPETWRLFGYSPNTPFRDAA